MLCLHMWVRGQPNDTRPGSDLISTLTFGQMAVLVLLPS